MGTAHRHHQDEDPQHAVARARAHVMGGRGPLRDRSSPPDYEPVRRPIRRLYPEIGEPKWQYHWNGRVAVTMDGLPHLHEPSPGLAVALGYNGRGVAMASRMGKLLADHAMGGKAETLGFPVSPLQPIRQFGLIMAAGVFFGSLSNQLLLPRLMLVRPSRARGTRRHATMESLQASSADDERRNTLVPAKTLRSATEEGADRSVASTSGW